MFSLWNEVQPVLFHAETHVDIRAKSHTLVVTVEHVLHSLVVLRLIAYDIVLRGRTSAVDSCAVIDDVTRSIVVVLAYESYPVTDCVTMTDIVSIYIVNSII